MEKYTIQEAIVKGDLNLSISETNRALAEGVTAKELIDNHLIVGMEIIGQSFEEGKAFVPNLLMAARAMKGSLDILKPLLKNSSATSSGRIVIGTVQGDLHDIGKNLVCSMLEGCGFDVVNLGVNVAAPAFIKAIKENNADILCMSALLTTTMINMGGVIKALEEEGIRNQVKVMIGGAPVSQTFADEIGADGYSDNANSAVALARQLLHN